MALTDKLTAIANAIRAKTGGTATMTLAEMPTEIASIQTGITPIGSVTLTSENTYDVTDKASAIVDFAATRANLAEAVTAKGVDTLPTSSFDTIATNIGLISGGVAPLQTVTITTTAIDIPWPDFLSQYFTLAQNKIYHIKNIGNIGNSGWHLMDIVVVYDTVSRIAGGIVKSSGTTKISSFGTTIKVDINIGDVFELYEIASV